MRKGCEKDSALIEGYFFSQSGVDKNNGTQDHENKTSVIRMLQEPMLTVKIFIPFSEVVVKIAKRQFGNIY